MFLPIAIAGAIDVSLVDAARAAFYTREHRYRASAAETLILTPPMAVVSHIVAHSCWSWETGLCQTAFGSATYTDVDGTERVV